MHEFVVPNASEEFVLIARVATVPGEKFALDRLAFQHLLVVFEEKGILIEGVLFEKIVRLQGPARADEIDEIRYPEIEEGEEHRYDRVTDDAGMLLLVRERRDHHDVHGLVI